MQVKIWKFSAWVAYRDCNNKKQMKVAQTESHIFRNSWLAYLLLYYVVSISTYVASIQYLLLFYCKCKKQFEIFSTGRESYNRKHWNKLLRWKQYKLRDAWILFQTLNFSLVYSTFKVRINIHTHVVILLIIYVTCF